MSRTCGIQLSPATSPTRPANTVVPKEASESRVSASRARRSRMTSAIDGTCTSRSGFSAVSASPQPTKDTVSPSDQPLWASSSTR